MRKAALLICAVLCWQVAAFAQAPAPASQTLSAEDRAKGVEYLEKTRQGVIDATKDISDAQWKFKAGADRWSAAETLEHIALAEDYIFGLVSEKVMNAPAGAPDRDYAKVDAAVLAMIPDRSHKAQAPPPLVPTGKWTPAESLDHFLKSRAKTIEFMKNTPDLRAHVVDQNPLGLPMDAYEFLLLISAHSERHTKQILEVKADAGYPKK